ncbi:MAG TPA: hypothetical protein VKQ34_02425, partial [Candidatus Saccharimonadales bacterium]|nr:hypothetical protein [Candidatus Saccharimonadales bacterium]
QTLMLDICLNCTLEEQINVEGMKKAVRELAPQLKDDDSNFDATRDELKKRSLIDKPKAAAPAAPPASAPPAAQPAAAPEVKK